MCCSFLAFGAIINQNHLMASNSNPEPNLNGSNQAPRLSVEALFDQGYFRPNLYLHLGFLAAATIILTMSFVMRAEGETSVYLPGTFIPMPESCSAKRLFGLDCPGCGLTRAFISISSGQLARAWHFNPASFLLYPFVVIQIPWNVFQISRIVRRIPPLASVWFFAAPILIAVALVVQWLVRMLV